MEQEVAVAWAAVVVVIGSDFAVAVVVAAVAGSGPHRYGGTPLVQGSPTRGSSYSRRSLQGRVLRVAVAYHRGVRTLAQVSP
jgi:hypothetical protein